MRPEARVEHVYAHRSGTLCEIVSEALGVPQEQVEALLELGAIWHSVVPPLPHPRTRKWVKPEQMNQILRAREQARVAHLFKELQQSPQRVRVDTEVSTGAYMRVHLRVKRFPVAHQTDWTSRIIHNAPTFVAVDKAAGIQCVPTEDNVVECLPTCIERVLELEEPLRPTHRLDEGTEGVVILAKTAEFASQFQKILAQRSEARIRKLYRCVTALPPKVGRLAHLVQEGRRFKGSPKYSAAVAEIAWPSLQGKEGRAAPACSSDAESDLPQHECLLEIIRVEQIVLSEEAMRCWGLTNATAFCSTVRLHTGRTHQIRCQLAEVGHPLLGDVLYATLRQLGALGGSGEGPFRGGQANGSLSSEQMTNQDMFSIPGELDEEALSASVSVPPTKPPASWESPSASGRTEHVGVNSTSFDADHGDAESVHHDEPREARIEWQKLLGGQDGRSRTGLQAWYLGVEGLEEYMEGDSPFEFEAGDPWWQNCNALTDAPPR
ncbi:hypothetical protein CYMTET_34762 [Cymbomonas tetramitiformis]|uniref:Pseudouridine synthase RsuA/RluA-like domain-containing protein n=1 Tax=Cymbomonas tetramitiformis TaxID=36881 RepID=A0AAE0KPW1_9CHLO|nr:hypothetical protein CYMTET_34762 [Cymbomonas tetramitiformis]